MNLSKPFIHRPVMTILVMASLMFFGIFSYRSLPVSDLPNIDFPTIQVTVSYPGANPDTMSVTCATPLENEFMTIDGLNTLFSRSSTGSTILILQFELDKDMDEASVDVQSAITRAQPNLPEDLPYNPTYQKLNPSQTPILYYAITSDAMTLAELYDYGYTYIGKRLNMIEGVSQVLTYGSPYAARIQVNPEKLASMGVGIDDVMDAIQKGNVDLPKGTLFGQKTEFTIDVAGQLLNAEGYNELAVRSKDGALVKIKDFGRALDSLQDDKLTLKFFNNNQVKPTVVIAVQTQPGANTVAVTDRINKILPTIQKELPPSLEYHLIFDKKEVIVESVNDVKITLLIAFILVVVIIYLCLGKFLNTIIPALAIPMSILGSFIIMHLLGFSIDILSLLALTLSIGFLVDDAIVVLENNVRHVQMGKNPLEASLIGSQEISITIFSMTFCLATVFIPMLFLGGVIGKLFREFSVTIIVAVLFSGFISLTLTPLLSSRFVPPYVKGKKQGVMARVADRLTEKMLSGYGKALTWGMHHKPIILALGLLSVLGAGYLYFALPKDLLPSADMGFIQGFTESRNGTSPFQMGRYQDDISSILQKNPNVDSFVSVVAISEYIPDNQGLFFIRLKPFKEREGINTVINNMMRHTRLAGVNTYLSPLPLINLQVGIGAKALYQYSLTSINAKRLYDTVPKLLAKMQKDSHFTQVSSDMEISQPQLKFTINRDRASDLKVTAKKIEDLFNYSYSDGKISTINTEINQYDVIIETLPEFYKDPSVMSSLFIRNTDNKMIPLNQIVEAHESVGPLQVNHLNGLPAATISFNLPDHIPLGTALETLSSYAKEVLPPNVIGTVEGTANVFKESFADLNVLFLVTIFVIYVVLGILYESFIHPITVMTALPPATFGGLFSLYLFNFSLDLYSFVGIIMLIGIVMKNGIMMVDFANQNIREGKKAYDAIFDACMARYRPIIMTSVSALMGAVPIALGIGGGSAEGRIPLGIAIVGGLIFSQILTLFLTPVIYYYFEVLQEKIKKFYKKRFHKENLG